MGIDWRSVVRAVAVGKRGLDGDNEATARNPDTLPRQESIRCACAEEPPPLIPPRTDIMANARVSRQRAALTEF